MAKLKAPSDGVAIRMFRQGHGDCFLLAFPRPNSEKPCYVLIDCGMKPGSQDFLKHKKPLRKVVLEDVHDACDGHLDLVILTHEHQDHLNGIWSENDPPFAGFEIEEAWMAWTEDPHGDEGFPRDHSFSFGEAARQPDAARISPFRRYYCVPAAEGLGAPDSFFSKRYGRADAAADEDKDGIEVSDDAAWRRIDADWLYSADTLAIKLNTGINNTSLAIAFELPQSKKVLLFAADAQRGNWFSWKDVKFDGTDTVDARSLLARAVLYKVGHHGSHNATLNGTTDDPHANLSWMAHGDHADEFVAMITAVNKWATTKNDPPWIHPLPSIKTALLKKAQGRVLQTDEDGPTKPSGISAAKWKKFTDRLVVDDLFFDVTIRDQQ